MPERFIPISSTSALYGTCRVNKVCAVSRARFIWLEPYFDGVATSRKKRVREATDRIKLTVEITPQLRERLYAYTAKTGVKLRFLVERALEEYLDKMGA
jgi:hypothetical protein